MTSFETLTYAAFHAVGAGDATAPRMEAAVTISTYMTGLSTLDWIIAAGYLLAGALCIHTGVLIHRDPSRGRRDVAFFWHFLAFVLILLGLNKATGFQMAITEAIRSMAKADGWYEHHRIVQAAFVGLVAGVAITSVGYLSWLARTRFRHCAVALLGVGFLLVVRIISATSFHYFDIALSMLPKESPIRWGLEFGGVCLVIIGTQLGKLGRGLASLRDKSKARRKVPSSAKKEHPTTRHASTPIAPAAPPSRLRMDSDDPSASERALHRTQRRRPRDSRWRPPSPPDS